MAENLNPQGKKYQTLNALWLRGLSIGERATMFLPSNGRVLSTSNVVDVIRVDNAHKCVFFETENTFYEVSFETLIN